MTDTAAAPASRRGRPAATPRSGTCSPTGARPPTRPRCPPTPPPSCSSWPSARPRRPPNAAGSPPSTTTTPQTGYASPGRRRAGARGGRPATPRPGLRAPQRRRRARGAAAAAQSSGWTAGVFGRRDRCLLVLSELAGVPVQAHRVAHRRRCRVRRADRCHHGAGATYRLTPAEDPVLCPACAVARWLEVLDVAVRHLATVAIAQHLREADRVIPSSPHRCRQPVDLHRADVGAAAACPHRPVGILTLPPARGCHRTPSPGRPATWSPASSPYTVTGRSPASRTPPSAGPAPAPAAPPYRPADWAAAVQRRRHDLIQLSQVADDLADVERRAAELNERVVQLLEHASASPDGR